MNLCVLTGFSRQHVSLFFVSPRRVEPVAAVGQGVVQRVSGRRVRPTRLRLLRDQRAAVRRAGLLLGRVRHPRRALVLPHTQYVYGTQS